MENINIVQKGINSAASNGKKTFSWHHQWATKKPLICDASPVPPEWLQDAIVSEMCDAN